MTDVTTIEDYPDGGPDEACRDCHNGHVYRYEAWSARYPYRYTDQRSGRSLLGHLRVVKAIPDPVRCFFCGDFKKEAAA